MSDFSIDPRAPVSGRAAGFIAASPLRVWELLSDLDSWPGWSPGVTEMHFQGPLQPGTEFDWYGGGRFIRSRLELVEPGVRLGWTGRTLGISARHVWTLTPEGAGTMAVSEESFSGLVPRLFPGRSRQALDAALQDGLAALSRRATAGARAA